MSGTSILPTFRQPFPAKIENIIVQSFKIEILGCCEHFLTYFNIFCAFSTNNNNNKFIVNIPINSFKISFLKSYAAVRWKKKYFHRNVSHIIKLCNMRH